MRTTSYKQSRGLSGGGPVAERRRILQLLAGAGGWMGMLWSWPALAEDRVRHPFEPDTTEATLQRLGADTAQPSLAIQLQVPDVAEDGAAVQMSLATTLPARRALILVRKNRIPLVAEFEFPPGVLPFVATRIKMAEDSEVLALVEAEGRWYSASRQVKVTLGGCGG